MTMTNFEIIAQELLKHKDRMDALQADNLILRQELANLRAGRGIFVEMQGQRFALSTAPELTPVTKATLAQNVNKPEIAAQTLSAPLAPSSQATKLQTIIPDTTEPEAVSKIHTAPQAIIKMSMARVEEVEVIEKTEDEQEVIAATLKTEEKKSVSTFLEEIMLDEFQTALTSPMAIWGGPVSKQTEIDEEQKASIRRELLGSYILE